MEDEIKSLKEQVSKLLEREADPAYWLASLFSKWEEEDKQMRVSSSRDPLEYVPGL